MVIDLSNILGKEFEGRVIETADDFSEILLEKDSVGLFLVQILDFPIVFDCLMRFLLKVSKKD